ncbi:unnamed protein product [Peniophora sp. CBMAI 1063]|nr:unnamed protein product [Peniophora sp. CBMAI 1063]
MVIYVTVTTSRLVLALVAMLVAAFMVNILRGLITRIAKRTTLRNVRGPESQSFLSGNLQDLYGEDGLHHLEALSEYGGVAKVHGLLGDVLLAISDPYALAHILVKNPQKYPAVDISGTLDMHMYFTGPGLISSNGPEHRRQRKLLNPAFSLTHIRRLTPLIYGVACQLRESIARYVTEHKPANGRVCHINLADFLGRAALEVVTQAGFGHTFRALADEGAGDKCARAFKDFTPTVSKLGPAIPLFAISGALRLPPRLLRLLGIAMSLVSPDLRHLMHIIDVIHDEIRSAWETHKVTRTSSKERKDLLLGALLDANEDGSVSDRELTAQAITLMFAGTETTSTALCRILYSLAMHPSVQAKLREEILQALASAEGHGDGVGLQYEALMALPFLDAVCKETLRVFPPAPYRRRRCIEGDLLPLSDGRVLYIPAGAEILTNIHGINTDIKIWGPDAKIWRPGRWMKPLPQSVSESNVPGVYSNLLTFLAGPKACIGVNFALLEMKTVLATVLPTFTFTLPTDCDIEWRFGEAITPSVKGENGFNPRMPLGVKYHVE